MAVMLNMMDAADGISFPMRHFFLFISIQSSHCALKPAGFLWHISCLIVLKDQQCVFNTIVELLQSVISLQ
jgi:hypothetical protein